MFLIRNDSNWLFTYLIYFLILSTSVGLFLPMDEKYCSHLWHIVISTLQIFSGGAKPLNSAGNDVPLGTKSTITNLSLFYFFIHRCTLWWQKQSYLSDKNYFRVSFLKKYFRHCICFSIPRIVSSRCIRNSYFENYIFTYYYD